MLAAEDAFQQMMTQRDPNRLVGQRRNGKTDLNSVQIRLLALPFRRRQCSWINGFMIEHVKKRSVNNFKRSVCVGDGDGDINKPS